MTLIHPSERILEVAGVLSKETNNQLIKAFIMDENTSKILLAIIAIIASIVGGFTIYSRNKSKNKKYNITQKNIDINGNSNKVVGGDDKSGN